MDIKSSIIACGLICSFQISRAAQCSYTLAPASASYSAPATNGSFSVSVGSSCSWSATTTNTDWITPSGSGTGNGTVTYTVEANAGAARIGAIVAGTKTFVINQAAPPPSLASALDTSNLVWTTGSDYPWTATTLVKHDGVDSAASGNKGIPNSISWLQTTVTGPGTLAFWWKVDSDVTPAPPADPVSFDYLEFDINGSQQAQILGQIDWNFRSYQIPEGTTTLNWQYVKDAQFNSGNDSAWLDQVAFVPGPQVSLAEAVNACGASWGSGGSVPTSWVGQSLFTHDGFSAAQSAEISLSQETWMEATVSGVTNLSYWWKVSCQTNFDYLEFYTNGVLAKRITGEVNWTSNFFKLPPTANTLRWRYVTTNMLYTSQGINRAWLDEVMFTPNDTQPPTIQYSPDNLVLSSGANCQAALPDLTGTNYFLAVDSCSSVTVTQSPLAGTLLSAGSYSVVLTALDAAGNLARSSNTVSVIDTNPPVIMILGDNPMTVECHSTFTDPGATASDNCTGSLGVLTNGMVLPNSPGTYLIRYSGSDLAGNSATNTRTVNVVDTTPPAISYHFTNLVLSADNGCQAILPDLTGTNYIFATDNCSSVVITQMPPAGTLMSQGTNLVVLTALDSTGNSVNSSNTVTVVDTIPPVISLVGTNPMTIECHSTFTDPGVSSVDNCAGTVTTITSGSVLSDSPGIYTITYTATDSSGNSATNSRTVNVVDTTPPTVLYYFTNLVLSTGANCQAPLPDLTGTNYFIAMDLCSSVTVTQNPPAGTLLAPGTNLVMLTASDVSGNRSYSTNFVTVVDATPPSIVYHFTNLILSAGSNCQASLPDLTVTNYILALDDCSSVTVTQDPPVGAVLAKGTNQVVLTARDGSGNTASVTDTVLVVDITAPALAAPATVVVSADPGQCAATNVSLGTPVATDNCNLVALTNNAPASFAVGTNLVSWTALDADGNFTNAVQLVIVNDTQAPTIACPEAVTANTDSGQSYASSVDLGTPVTSDNCGIAVVTNDAPTQFSIGTNLVTWIVFDIHGNSNSCVQQVIVSAPSQLPHQVTGITNNGDGTFTVTFLGTPGVDYMVQISSNLVDWSCVQTNKAFEDGAWSYTDHETTNVPARFYRAMRQ